MELEMRAYWRRSGRVLLDRSHRRCAVFL